MNAIDKYNETKYKAQRFEQWAGKLGKEYFGGTRGEGNQYGEIISASGHLTIYHQEYDGATNYHEMDKNFDYLLSAAMKTNGHLLVKEMREILSKELEAAKAEAQKLAAELTA